MNNVKELTRGSLESVFKMNARRVDCLVMKQDAIRDRIRAIIKDVKESDATGGISRDEVTGRLKALVNFINENDQFQFKVEDKPLATYSNGKFLAMGLTFGIIISGIIWIAIVYRIIEGATNG